MIRRWPRRRVLIAILFLGLAGVATFPRLLKLAPVPKTVPGEPDPATDGFTRTVPKTASPTRLVFPYSEIAQLKHAANPCIRQGIPHGMSSPRTSCAIPTIGSGLPGDWFRLASLMQQVRLENSNRQRTTTINLSVSLLARISHQPVGWDEQA
jgi:hypothetical protein